MFDYFAARTTVWIVGGLHTVGEVLLLCLVLEGHNSGFDYAGGVRDFLSDAAHCDLVNERRNFAGFFS